MVIFLNLDGLNKELPDLLRRVLLLFFQVIHQPPLTAPLRHRSHGRFREHRTLVRDSVEGVTPQPVIVPGTGCSVFQVVAGHNGIAADTIKNGHPSTDTRNKFVFRLHRSLNLARGEHLNCLVGGNVVRDPGLGVKFQSLQHVRRLTQEVTQHFYFMVHCAPHLRSKDRFHFTDFVARVHDCRIKAFRHVTTGYLRRGVLCPELYVTERNPRYPVRDVFRYLLQDFTDRTTTVSHHARNLRNNHFPYRRR
ncbi:hypothetical protein CF95_gp141 [Erwinia phage PhiEaH1]|uniref:Uncharacterized protein n=1 Tax=Erwinia phage PhiEaH1 TaxID=1401669 RepID=W8D0I3_9CAUD|nr:hypothetical protein CF95_gp141 [Erwinia phage PhiEaH1]AGX01863.1 hypothetical protein [Erwinia phage PhiEaH1]